MLVIFSQLCPQNQSGCFFVIIQEPFDPEAFVERLAKRTMQVSFRDNSKDQLDPVALQETFMQAIK